MTEGSDALSAIVADAPGGIDYPDDTAGRWHVDMGERNGANGAATGGGTRRLERALTSDDRVFFLHIPKTAGTTLGNTLDGHFPRSRIFPHYSIGEMDQVDRGMCDGFTYFRGHFKYDAIRDMLGREPVCITMLRDPIERFISHFAQWQRWRLGGDDVGFEAFPFEDLADYVAHEDFVAATRNINAQVDIIAGESGFDHYDELVTDLGAVQRWSRHPGFVDIDLGPRQLSLARERLASFAFVGIAEQFQDSLFLLSYTFGWRPILDGERLNVTPQRPLREQLDARTIERIVSFNTLDIDLYAHAARLFAERYAGMTEDLLSRYAAVGTTRLSSPSHATMHDLLERHYEQRFAEAHPPVRDLRIDFEEPLSGRGWYPPESLPGHGTVRWTGPECTATLDLPLAADSDLFISFRVVWALEPDALAALTLAVNDRRVALRAWHDHAGATIYAGRIPQATLASEMPFARLAFSIPRTAATGKPGDPRRLGLLFNWIEIHP